jgi:TRAP-type C4-dicarboxylate transport system permease small subunit
MTLKKIEEKMGLISFVLSRVGCAALFFMVILTVVDVIGRYVFNAPILGAFEMTEFLVLILVFSFLGYAQAKKSHVTVDILFDRFPGKLKTIVTIFNYLLCIVIIFIIAWMGFEKGIETFHTGEKPLNLAIPNWPFVFFLSFGSAVMCIEFIRNIIKVLNRADGERK